MNPRLPRRRIWRAMIYFVSFALILLAIDLLLIEKRRAIHPGFGTTRIIAPLQSDGTVDYLMALEARYGQGVTPENNAVPLLLQAIGRAALPRNQPTDGITDRLGMPHLPEQGDYLVSYAAFMKTKPQSVYADPDLIGMTTIRLPVSIPENTAAWVKANERPLAMVERAAERPRFFLPYYGGNRPEMVVEILLPHIQPLREIGQLLLLRAATRLQSGEIDAGLRDLATLHRLARLLVQGATLIERVAGAALDSSTLRLERAAAGSGKLSADQLRAMAAELAQLPDLPPIIERVDTAERYMGLDALQKGSRIGPAAAGRLFNAIGGGTYVSPTLFRWTPISYDRSMRELNHWYDGAMVALSQPTYARRDEALRLWQNDLMTLQQESEVYKFLTGDWLATVFMPALRKTHQNAEAARMETRLTQVAIGLALFKSERSAYPASLSELSPKYLPTVPLDSFTGRPLVYAPTAAGYTLYSVGPNMEDDNGQSAAPGDDIVASQP